MKAFIQNTKIFFISVIGLLLVSCGGGSGGGSIPEKPTVIPTGSISVIATLGPIQNANVIVYDYSKGTISNANILSEATQVTDSNGKYTIDVQSVSTPILVCVSKGKYIEEASDINQKVEITIADGDSLCAVANYSSGTNVNLNITFFTHVAYGLSINNFSNGAKIEDAITTANQTINDWLGSEINILTTIPKQITKPNSIPANINNPLTPEHKYGFANAAISQLMKWVAKNNKITPFTNVTSVIFAQRAFEDISADGILDGKAGVNQLAIVEPITEDLYRHKFALNMLIMASTPENNSTLTVDSIFSYAESINNYSALSINPDPTTVLTKSSPIIDVTNPNSNDVIFGNALLNSANNTPFDPLSNAFVAATVTDVAGIESLLITINNPDGTVQTTLQSYNFDQIKTPFDSKLISDGNYTINITATNILGKTTSFAPIAISIGNTVISANIDTPLPDSANGGASIIVTGSVNEPANTPLKSIELKLDGNLIPVDQPIDLASSTNSINATIDSIAAPGLSDGPHVLELVATSTSGTRQIGKDSIIFNIDNTKPTVLLSQSSQVQNNNIFSQSGSISFLYDLSDPLMPASTGYSSGLGYAEFLFSGALIGKRINNLNSTLTVPFNPLSMKNGVRDYADGWYELTLNVTDMVGNNAKNTTTIGIDTRLPTISITKPLNAVSGSIPTSITWINNLIIEGTAIDIPGTGIFSVEIFDPNFKSLSKTTPPVGNLNLSINKRKTSLPFIYQSPNGRLFDGKYKFTIRTTDYANNIEENIINIGIDTLPPKVTYTFITDPSLQPYKVTFDWDGNPVSGGPINAKCILDTTSNDPGYANNTSSGLLKQEIFIEDNAGTIPTIPTIKQAFINKNSETIKYPISIDYLTLSKFSYTVSRKIIINTFDGISNGNITSLPNKNVDTITKCIILDVVSTLSSSQPPCLGFNCKSSYDIYPKCRLTRTNTSGNCI